jgi:hypothetical protein
MSARLNLSRSSKLQPSSRVAEVVGRLTHEVKFGGGLLGHLDSGGDFDVKQAEVAPGFWELTVLNVHMKGKALFFRTIGGIRNIRALISNGCRMI